MAKTYITSVVLEDGAGIFSAKQSSAGGKGSQGEVEVLHGDVAANLLGLFVQDHRCPVENGWDQSPSAGLGPVEAHKDGREERHSDASLVATDEDLAKFGDVIFDSEVVELVHRLGRQVVQSTLRKYNDHEMI
jgi:hypothetical protein